ncbi:glucosaminidase domain-containing protein [Marinimicrobium sp. ABcell2]|uniref:glucosaminidase domain-containing protein n=1 Tax=Marinimicrobium sp. ABcell2 TaxID=3069751 RepID=UPI0027B4BC84|nr:glucosaminidase domain-containing protein [Marinimicrobium sp. ABcell2]MDQ2076493.1 glucosaminidase domain-containing protein [Marinimicrobium sp. ABcell2]
MTQSAHKWVLASVLLAFPLFCLALTFYLMHNPPHFDPVEVTETTPQPPKLKALPPMAEISHIPERKETFINLLLPMIEWRNSEMSRKREELQAMQAAVTEGEELTPAQLRRLQALREHFRVTEENFPELDDALAALLLRVDIIPQEMVLAQAAAESGWGTSRFAVDANNLFGQWCYRQGCGLVPERRREGARHEVQKFSSVNEAVASYYRNINTHRAYRELRQKRASLREAGEPIRGELLVTQLQRYSSRGQAYVDELLELIRFNDLANVTVTQADQDTLAGVQEEDN